MHETNNTPAPPLAVMAQEPSVFDKVFGDWATWEKVVFAVSTTFVALGLVALGSSLPLTIVLTAAFAVAYVGIRWMSCSNSKEALAARKCLRSCADLAQCLHSTVAIFAICKHLNAARR